MIRWLALLALLLFPSLAHAQATVVSSCGSVTYTAGTPHNVTIDTNGQSCQVGGGSGTVTPTSVWSATDAAANGMTLSNGGLTVVATTSTWQSIRGSISHTSGKYYMEFWASGTPGSPNSGLGLADAGFVATNYLSTSNYSAGCSNSGAVVLASSGFTAGSGCSSYAPSANDVFQIAVDLTAGKIWIGINNVWEAGNPGAGTGQMINIVSPALGLALYPTMSVNLPTSGIWTIKGSAASQKYAPPSGFTAWDAAAAPGCSQATAYLARATGETAHASDLTTLICGLVTDGVWAKLDALYVLAQQTQADARLNLVSVSYPLTGTATFTAYQGFSAFLTNGVLLDTGFNPSVAPSPNFTQNSANFGIWSYAVVNDLGAEIGIDTSITNILDDYSGTFYGRVNGNGITIPVPGTKGLFVGDRATSSTATQFWNGASINSATDVSAALVSATFTIGGVGGYRTDQTLSEAHIGGSLGSAGNLALYNRLRTYLTSVGVP